MVATLLVSFLFNAWAADNINPKQWHPQSIFISVLYSACFLIYYLVQMIGYIELHYNEYTTDEEENF